MKYVLLLSAKTEDRLKAVYRQAAGVLHQRALRFLRLRPHIVLFEYDGDIQSAASLFPIQDVPHDFVVVIAIGDCWRGRARADQAAELDGFFYPKPSA